MCGSMVDIHIVTADNRRGNKKKKTTKKKAQLQNLPYWTAITRLANSVAGQAETTDGRLEGLKLEARINKA